MSEASPGRIDIPDYELLRQIGRGSYGDVWLARGVTGVFRAVKIVWRDRFADLRPYEREFEGITRFAAVSLREPSQLALLHAGRNDAAGFFYYVMELADDIARGREISAADYAPLTLKEVAQRRPGPAIAEVVELGVQLARALGSLHAAGLVHRDIKPSNIIFVGGVPKFADVGLVAAASAQLTFVGTEGFVPPEGPGSPAADVFALGKVLYELATGCDRQEFPRLPEGLGQRADRRELLELNEVLLRACEPQPARRHAEAGALLDELLLLQAGKSVRRLRSAERRVTRALRIAAALALIAVVAGTGAYVERRRANEEMALRAQAEAERDALARRTVYAANIANAQAALARGDYGRARQLLAESQPAPGATDLRGFEWWHLWPQAQGDPARTWRENGSAIYRVVVSRGGEWLAVHDASQRATIYAVSSGVRQCVIDGVRRVAGFSDDGTRLLGTDANQRLAHWSVADGLPRLSRDDSVAPYLLGCLRGDRVVALVNGNPARLLVWDALTDRVASVEIETREPGAAQPWEFFRGGVAWERDEVAVAWTRREQGTSNFRLTAIVLAGVGGPRVVHCAAPARPSAAGVDGMGVWAAPGAGGALWRFGPEGVSTDRTVWVEREVSQLLRLPDEGWVAVQRERLAWYDAAGKLVRQGRGHLGLIGDFARDQRTGRVFSGTQAGELREWLAAGGKMAAFAVTAAPPAGNPTRLAFSPDGQRLSAAWPGGGVATFDARDGRVVALTEGLRYPAWSDGEVMIGVAADGAGVVLAGAATGRMLHRAEGVLQLQVSRDGGAVCASDSAGRLWWQRRGDEEARRVVDEGYQYRFGFASDAALERLWSVGRDNELVCLRLSDGVREWSVRLPALAPGLCVSPDGRWLAAPMDNAQLQLRDPRIGTVRRTLLLGGSTPQVAVFSADGRRLFVGGSRGDVLVLETQFWLQVATLQVGGADAIHQMAAAPDGSALAVLTKTGALHVLRTR